MISAGSRYEDGDRQFVTSHLYDANGNVRVEDDAGSSLYQRPRVVSRSAVYLTATLPLPDLPEGKYYAKEDQHMPLLAFRFMEDSQMWWRLADVNPHVWYPLDLQVGDEIRVPGT